MKFFFLSCALLHTAISHAWGFYGHRKINETAVYTLPKPLFGFYKQHVDYLVKHATDADNRRYVVEAEACRHFLDGDHYESHLPLDTIPKFYKDACLKYTEDSVLSHGIVPWHIQTMMFRLTEAFKSKDIQKILKYSADLGHYIGDCHVPLHSTSNYNGQKTGQSGIHALWESRLPELFNPDFDLFTGLAVYQKNTVNAIWKAFGESYGLVDSVLKTERLISSRFTPDLKYAFEPKGNTSVRVYSKEFCHAYHEALGHMVEERMRASIVMLGSFWYTCWVNAGQPDLPDMPLPEQAEDQEQKKANELMEKGKMLGRGEE
jgi:hypothetical protein